MTLIQVARPQILTRLVFRTEYWMAVERDAEKLQVCVVVNTTGDVAVVVDAVLLIGMPVTRVEFLSVLP